MLPAALLAVLLAVLLVHAACERRRGRPPAHCSSLATPSFLCWVMPCILTKEKRAHMRAQRLHTARPSGGGGPPSRCQLCMRPRAPPALLSSAHAPVTPGTPGCTCAHARAPQACDLFISLLLPRSLYGWHPPGAPPFGPALPTAFTFTYAVILAVRWDSPPGAARAPLGTACILTRVGWHNYHPLHFGCQRAPRPLQSACARVWGCAAPAAPTNATQSRMCCMRRRAAMLYVCHTGRTCFISAACDARAVGEDLPPTPSTRAYAGRCKL